jgi:hypothetical protein
LRLLFKGVSDLLTRQGWRIYFVVSPGSSSGMQREACHKEEIGQQQPFLHPLSGFCMSGIEHKGLRP